jgi:prolipoprotein diacylglyceryltransferase
LEIRWYSLAYIIGIILGWIYCKKKLIKDRHILSLFDDFITYLIIGVILGGRIGYALFYNLKYYFEKMKFIVGLLIALQMVAASQIADIDLSMVMDAEKEML